MANKDGKHPGPGHGTGEDEAAELSRLPRKVYEQELFRLQAELVELQEWVRAEGARLVVDSDDKRRARINMIAHLLSTIPYHDEQPAPIKLPPRPPSQGYVRAPRELQTYVPDHADTLT